jgi:hypothetical protein
MVLTVFAIENAKPREKSYKLSDGNGLALLVEANGSKLWRFRYRFGGKENMLTFGAFPEVTLAQGRSIASAWLSNNQTNSAASSCSPATSFTGQFKTLPGRRRAVSSSEAICNQGGGARQNPSLCKIDTGNAGRDIAPLN